MGIILHGSDQPQNWPYRAKTSRKMNHLWCPAVVSRVIPPESRLFPRKSRLIPPAIGEPKNHHRPAKAPKTTSSPTTTPKTLQKQQQAPQDRPKNTPAPFSVFSSAQPQPISPSHQETCDQLPLPLASNLTCDVPDSLCRLSSSGYVEGTPCENKSCNPAQASKQLYRH